MSKYHSKNQGFSLMELMVVIAIIAILAATGIPSYLKYLQRASLAEAVTVLGNYKTALGVYWSTESELPSAGDTLVSTPVDLPFGTTVTTFLPESLESLRLSGYGNGVLITAVVDAGIFSTYAAGNRTVYLGAKPQGREIIFACGNFTTNATSTSDLGFTDRFILPSGCNYNGVGAWLTS